MPKNMTVSQWFSKFDEEDQEIFKALATKLYCKGYNDGLKRINPYIPDNPYLGMLEGAAELACKVRA